MVAVQVWLVLKRGRFWCCRDWGVKFGVEPLGRRLPCRNIRDEEKLNNCILEV